MLYRLTIVCFLAFSLTSEAQLSVDGYGFEGGITVPLLRSSKSQFSALPGLTLHFFAEERKPGSPFFFNQKVGINQVQYNGPDASFKNVAYSGGLWLGMGRDLSPDGRSSFRLHLAPSFNLGNTSRNFPGGFTAYNKGFVRHVDLAGGFIGDVEKRRQGRP